MGTNNPNLISSMGSNGKPGASLRAFRDFLPQSKIFGADVDKDILFQEERITTIQVDQLDRNSFNALSKDEAYDLIIDDGLHSTPANLNTMIWAMQHLRAGGYIVIEDVANAHRVNWKVVEFIISHNSQWEGQLVMCKGGGLYVLHKSK